MAKRILMIGGVGCLLLTAIVCGAFLWMGNIALDLGNQMIGVVSPTVNARTFIDALIAGDMEAASQVASSDPASIAPTGADEIRSVIRGHSAYWATNGRGEMFYDVRMDDGSDRTVELTLSVQDSVWVVTSMAFVE